MLVVIKWVYRRPGQFHRCENRNAMLSRIPFVQHGIFV